MTTASEVQSGQGIFVTGEFISLKPGQAREDSSGNTREPWLLRVLADENMLTIEYWDEKAARSLLAGAAERGDVLTVPVYARAYKDRVYWRGVSADGRD